MSTKELNISEITYGTCPPEMTIVFNETVRSVDLNRIVLMDIRVPNSVSGLKLTAVQTG
jgi:hypothetical protein